MKRKKGTRFVSNIAHQRKQQKPRMKDERRTLIQIISCVKFVATNQPTNEHTNKGLDLKIYLRAHVGFVHEVMLVQDCGGATGELKPLLADLLNAWAHVEVRVLQRIGVGEGPSVVHLCMLDKETKLEHEDGVGKILMPSGQFVRSRTRAQKVRYASTRMMKSLTRTRRF